MAKTENVVDGHHDVCVVCVYYTDMWIVCAKYGQIRGSNSSRENRHMRTGMMRERKKMPERQNERERERERTREWDTVVR